MALLLSYYQLSRHSTGTKLERHFITTGTHHHYGTNRSRQWHAMACKSGVRRSAKTGSVIGVLKHAHICTSALPTFTVTPGCLWVRSKNHNVVKLLDSKPSEIKFLRLWTSGQRPATVAASFVALFSPSKQVLLYKWYLKERHYRFLPHPFLFTVLHGTLHATGKQPSSRNPKNVRIKIHELITSAVVLYGCEYTSSHPATETEIK
jgi:hypothetical protein